MTRKLALALALAFLTPVVAGCGADDDTSASDGVDEASVASADGVDDEASTDEDGEGGESSGSGSDPCDIDLAPLAAELDGVDLGEGSPVAGDSSVQDVEWTPSVCHWESSTVELRVALADAEDFAGGFVCAEALGVWGEVETIDEVGDQAWFEWNDFQGGAGRFSGCTGELRVDITVSGPRDGTPITEESARAGALALAHTLL